MRMSQRVGIAVLMFGVTIGTAFAQGPIEPGPTPDVICPGFCGPDTLDQPGKVEASTSVVSEFEIYLFPWQRATFHTSNSTPGGDPVLHLLDSNGHEVARDNNGFGGVDARLSYSPGWWPLSGSSYRLILRATNNNTRGYTQLYRDTDLIADNIAYGGWTVRLKDLRANETIETIRLANGSRPPHRLYLLNDTGNIRSRYQGGGTAGATRFSALNTGTMWVVVGVADENNRAPVRLLRNDAALSDQDNDGLGNELENALGTCSGQSESVRPSDDEDAREFECSLAIDTRDTDGDGISDGWEVLGRGDLLPNQPLPMWGADPRHKDIFIEVDFMQTCPSTNPVDSFMPAGRVREFADYYGDKLETLSPSYAEFHANLLRNPDFKPGINVHIDTGQAPTAPQDATLFGDWGGHNVVAAIDGDSGGACPEDFVGRTAKSQWTSQMSLSRRGIFHYALGYLNGGGQAPHWTVYSSWNHNKTKLAVHEFGHTMGIGHSGPAFFDDGIDPNCKPSYPSIMNYGYYDDGGVTVGFSDGIRSPNINNVSASERNFISHTLSGEQFAQLGDPPPPASRDLFPKRERDYLEHLDKVFDYNLTYAYQPEPTNSRVKIVANVDWNRNGTIQDKAVRAYTNYRRSGSGCEWTRANSFALPDKALSELAPVLARIRIGETSHTYAFWSSIRDGKLNYATSTDSFNCPVPVVGSCNGDSFSGVKSIDIDASRGVAVTRTRLLPSDGHGSGDLLNIISTDIRGQLWWTRLWREGGQDMIESESIPANLALGQPTAVTVHPLSFYVAYRNSLDRKVWMLRHSVNGWSTDEKARQRVNNPQDPNGPQIIQDLPQMNIENSPHIDFTYLPAPLKTKERHLYGFFADNIRTIHIYRYDVNEKLWTKVDPWERDAQLQIQQPMNTRGRPTTAWVPFSTSDEWPGRLYLMWRSNSNAPQMAYTHTTGIAPATQNHFLGMVSSLDNNSTRAQGLGLYFESKHDSNLRLLSSQGTKPILFRPKADGISDYNLEDQSDWFTFSVTTCRSLIYPYAFDQSTIDPELTNPIGCLPWPWGLP